MNNTVIRYEVLAEDMDTAIDIHQKPVDERTEEEGLFLNLVDRIAEALGEAEKANRELGWLKHAHPHLKGRNEDELILISDEAEEILSAMRESAWSKLVAAGWTMTSDLRWKCGEIEQDDPPDIAAAKLLEHERMTRMAFISQNAEKAFWRGVETTEILLEAGEDHLVGMALSMIQSKRSKGVPRRPRLRTRAMLAAFADGRHTADAVEGFFRDGGVYEDQWGEISIYPDGGAFVVTDEGAKLSAGGQRPKATITRESLPVLIAQIRKKPA